MPSNTDDLQFFDLSHRWGHCMPQWPSRANLNVRVLEFHAKDGLLVQQFEGIMHRGTHMDAPIHVQENTPTITGYPLWRFFGTGVAVSIPKGKWGVITAKDLENAEPKIRKNDIVMINTGSHLKYGDNPETGRNIIDDFPYWEPAHKIMMTNGIPGIENIGGDIDEITGKRCTFFAFPWRWPDGEGCALRVVAVLDPHQTFRFETGQ